MKIKIIKTDITTLDVDAIVNAANKWLIPGGGVDGAIHAVAGPELAHECSTLGACNTGQSKITKAYNLPCKHVIHTVGPIHGEEKGEENNLLADCYYSALTLANENKLSNIAFPAISTGIFRFPKDEASKIALKTIIDFFKNENEHIKEVIIVVRDEENYYHYKKHYNSLLNNES